MFKAGKSTSRHYEYQRYNHNKTIELSEEISRLIRKAIRHNQIFNLTKSDTEFDKFIGPMELISISDGKKISLILIIRTKKGAVLFGRKCEKVIQIDINLVSKNKKLAVTRFNKPDFQDELVYTLDRFPDLCNLIYKIVLNYRYYN